MPDLHNSQGFVEGVILWHSFYRFLSAVCQPPKQFDFAHHCLFY